MNELIQKVAEFPLSYWLGLVGALVACIAVTYKVAKMDREQRKNK